MDIDAYLKLSPDGAAFVDSAFAQTVASPAVFLGTKQNLNLHCGSDADSPSDFSDIVSWEFVIDNDYNTADDPLFAVTSGISAVDGVIAIPLVGLNTEALAAALGENASLQLGAELVGYKANETYPSAILQFNLTLKNRRLASGTAASVALSDLYATLAQVNALIADLGIDGKIAAHNSAGDAHSSLFAAKAPLAIADLDGAEASASLLWQMRRSLTETGYSIVVCVPSNAAGTSFKWRAIAESEFDS